MLLKEVKLGQLNNGDQIAVQGNVEDLSPWLLLVTAHSDGKYFHHGIFLKDECAVIDFHGQTKEDARPKKRDFLEFFQGHTTLYRVEYNPGECLPVDETIQKAEETLEQGTSWPTYDLIKNNCESFATYLKTGVAKSKQVLAAMISMLHPTGAFRLVAGSVQAGTKAAAGSLKAGKKAGSFGGSK